MKKVVLLIAFLILFCVYVLSQHMLVYVYTNPYTNISSLKYITPTIKAMDKIFNNAKSSCKRQGVDIKFLYFNAYGSGFVNNNPIPNDLDTAIGVYLGKFDYDDKNGTEIADKLVDNMNTFQYSVYFYANTMPKNTITPAESPLKHLEELNKITKMQKDTIKNTLDLAIAGENYVQYTKKGVDGLHKKDGIDVPYIMKSGEILLEDRHPIQLYSSLVDYNGKMPHYIREISIVPEYYADIKYNNKTYRISFVAEAALGERLQLVRRFFAPQIYIHPYSANYLQNIPLLKDNEQYIYHRLFSYKRHLQETNNLNVLKKKPTKIFKRLMQLADIIYPVISDDEYKEISNFVSANLNKKSIILLNEYMNTYINLKDVVMHAETFFALSGTDELDRILNSFKDTISRLENLEELNQTDKTILKKFAEPLLKCNSASTREDLAETSKLLLKPEYLDVWDDIVNIVYKQIEHPEKIDKYIDTFNKVYLDAGFHKVSLYWLDKDTIGILKDDFTEKIDDLDKFAKMNNLVNVKYKYVDVNNAPLWTMRYDVFARYNPTEQEEENYKKMENILIKDKENFYIRKKFVFFK